jgi:hypothetical protein
MLTHGSACIVGIVRIAYLHQLRVLDITCKLAFSLRASGRDLSDTARKEPFVVSTSRKTFINVTHSARGHQLTSI